MVHLDADVRVDGLQPVPRRLHLRPSQAGRIVQDLPLQVARIDRVVVDDAERADAGGGKIHGGG